VTALQVARNNSRSNTLRPRLRPRSVCVQPAGLQKPKGGSWYQPNQTEMGGNVSSAAMVACLLGELRMDLGQGHLNLGHAFTLAPGIIGVEVGELLHELAQAGW